MLDAVSSLAAWWQGLSTRGKVIVGLLATGVVVAIAIVLMVNRVGTMTLDPEDPTASYVTIFVLIALDAVIPIFPGETTLNAAATFAAQGKLELWPIIVAGALGAIVGDSALFWIARKFSRRIQPQLDRAKADRRVQAGFDLLDSSSAILIIGGRYVPGMRFVVNATMGLSDIRYRRFFLWSFISGWLWSIYTTLLAYKIGLALGEYPFASFVISGLVTTVVLAVIFFTLRRRRRSLTTPSEG